LALKAAECFFSFVSSLFSGFSPFQGRYWNRNFT
jgi:hypothetical protein